MGLGTGIWESQDWLLNPDHLTGSLLEGTGLWKGESGVPPQRQTEGTGNKEQETDCSGVWLPRMGIWEG